MILSTSIIHPSYGRPQLAISTAKKWISNSRDYKDNPAKLEYILVVAQTDPLRSEYIDLVSKVGYPIRVITSPHANMVKQMNIGAKLAAGDLLIAVSDDFSCPDDWANTLIKKIGNRADVLVKTDDGMRIPGIDTSKLITLPIMDRLFYDSIGGYIYHPQYNHFYGDEELSIVGDLLKKKIVVDMTFEHLHYMAGKAKEDATNRKNNRFFLADKATFSKRKRKNFGL